MIYVDSSVPLLALMEQTGGSEAAALDEHRGEALRKVSSALLDVEVSRALRREGLDPALADALLGLILVISIHLPLQAKEVMAILFGLTGWSALTVRLIRALRRRDQSGLLPHVDL